MIDVEAEYVFNVKEYGAIGDCYIKFDDLEYLLNQRGECCFLLNRTIHPERRRKKIILTF